MKIPVFVVSLLLLSASSYSQVNLNLGLLAYYPFNGDAKDASGNGNNGVPMNGVQLATDKLGNLNSAYLFDGIDDYINIPNSSSLNPSNGMSIVVQFNPGRNGLQNLIGKIAYSGGVATQYQVAMDYSLYPGVLFGVNPITNGCAGVPLNSAYVNTNSAINPNQWYCVVATFENGVQKIYLDGTLVQTKNAGFSTLNQCSNADIRIGVWWQNDLLPFKGKIDEVRIYNRALNQDEISSLCNNPQIPCNNWLSLPSEPSYVRVGDLDVPGNQITVEAMINRTTPWSGGPLYAGDIVSKHEAPVNVNYLLRPNHAEITTTNGYFRTPDICDIDLNKTYHIAMVYDGAQLKFYRNGHVMSQVAATGNLFQNDFETRIGWYEPQIYHTNFIGYINEVRIWNVARTQSQLQGYMDNPLPSPTTQTGLLAYYTFDNLINKQGNPAWNATLAGTATINKTNPACPEFVADSCCPILSGTLVGSNVCSGGNGTLTFTASAGQGPFTITYTDGTNLFTQNNVQSGVPFTVSPNPTTTISYSVLSIDDALPCPASPISNNTIKASITFLSNSGPPDSIHLDNPIQCAGTNVQLTVKGGSLGSGAEWKWYSNNCNGSLIGSGSTITTTPLYNTSYFVRAEGTCNTTSCVSIPISVFAKPNVIFDSIPPICDNEGNIQLNEAREISGLAGTGRYSGRGVNSSGLFSTPTVGSGTYSLIYTFVSSEGCAGSSSRNMVVNPAPVANAGKDIIACADIPVQLHASGGKKFEWVPITGLNDPTIADPVLTTNVGQTYILKVTGANGCADIDSMSVFISVNKKEFFKVPNAFTPNADGKNDCFGIKKWGDVEIKEFSVFNRWGQKVFSTKNPSDCWDGTFKGIKQDSGGYVYLIRVNTACGEVFLKGVVTMLR